MSVVSDESAAIIKAAREFTGRSCGDCSMCCKLLHIAEIDKPANQWCKHCRPGSGCTIYNDRPEVCSGFACGWLLNSDLGEEWKPSRSKIMVHEKIVEGTPKIIFVVDPSAPHQWRKDPFYKVIKRFALCGLSDGSFQTIVDVGNREWVILPDEDVEITGSAGYVILPAGHGWKVQLHVGSETVSDFMQKAAERTA